ncbi:MAG: hypothetical protein ACE5GW_01420 [Planctomycetota bacterium]
MGLETLYLICAAVGGALLVVQFLLLLIGFDHGPDGDLSEFELDESGAGGNPFFGLLSAKTIVAFFTFFGLTGLLVESLELGFHPAIGVFISFGAGLLAFYLVGLIATSLYRLQSQGNIDLKNVLGRTGTVYLKIPPERSGAGKVTVTVQKRTFEAPAITSGEQLETGTQVMVVDLLGEKTLEVKPLA